DGAHIRTLLLTFFHRQMPEIIKAGHLFIAQPPLFKVAKGKSEVYLKDQGALDRHLVEAGLADRVLESASGARAGADLADLVDQALLLKNLIAFAPRKYDASVIEAMAMAGALATDMSPADRNAALARAAAQLQLGDSEAEWSARLTDSGEVRFDRVWRGVADVHLIEGKFLSSAEARKLHARGVAQAETYASPARLVKAGSAPVEVEASDEAEADSDMPLFDPDSAITRPSQLLDAVLAAGRKGLSISRYKGLGEMNAEQLWETTLDPENRELLQVKVEDADVTDEIFTRLMGDVVEPRREFIQENALNVANLDV
ncbi:MAG: DNA gyrase subunit B, partial [Erythrobacter sp.]|nr:DNA gyrase subunit B [Erythrobacter sp.]